MKIQSWSKFTTIVGIILLSGCSLKPPNKPICFTDAPSHANCAWMVNGADFQVDNVGHNFTQDGRNWNYDQLMKNSLILPPDTYGAEKKFFLSYCHQHPKDCNYSAAVEHFRTVELMMGMGDAIPEWDDSMLDEIE